MSKTLFTTLLLLTCLLTGCRKSGTEPVVVYLRMGSPIEQGIWREVFSAVKTRNPDIAIKVLNVPYEGYWSKLFTMCAAGNPPDMVMMESGFYQSFVKKNTLLDLTQRIQQSQHVHAADYHHSTMEWLTVDGKLYGLPSDTAVILPIFNLDLFSRAGVPPPGPDWTWEDYLKIAQKLTRDENGDGKPEIYGTGMPPWECAVWAWSGKWVDDLESPTRCIFDDPKVMAAIQWVADLRLKYKVAFRSEQVQAAQPDFFLNGNIAIAWNGHWAIPDYIAKADFKWDVGMLPVGPGGRGGWNRGSCFSIPAKAKQPDKAWRVMEFICSEEGSKLFAGKNMMTPVHQAVINSREFLNMHPPEHQQYFVEALEHGNLLPKTTAFRELNSMIVMELEHVWNGEEDVPTVCRRIAAKGTELLSRGKP